MTGPGVDSWYHEKESAWLYRRVAAAEPDEHRRRLFEPLALAAEEQAARWEQAAARGAAGAAHRTFTPSMRARIVARLLERFEPASLRAVLAAMKLRGLSVYSALSGAIVGHAMPTSLAEVGARHRSTLGGSLRAAVFGVNDGLLSNLSLVLGVAGAGAARGYVLMSGTAGLLAGALSMAAGEYVSVRSQREMYEYQIALEREELGLNPDDLGSPWRAASASFVTFAAGALLPLAPFLAGMAGNGALAVSAALTAVALFGVGLGLSLFTGRDALRSALRMVLIGGGAGTFSFLVGRALGVAIS